jgi:competence protein ComEC
MPLLWLSAAFLSGVLLGSLYAWSVQGWLILSFVSILSTLLWRLVFRFLPSIYGRIESFSNGFPKIIRNFNPPISYLLLLAVLFLGAARYESTRPDLIVNRVDRFNDTDEIYILEGLIKTQPDERDGYTNLTVDVEQIHPLGDKTFIAVQGKLLARLSPGGDYQYGDRVRIKGRLRTPFETEEFSYQDYLAHKGIYTTLSCYRYNYECTWLLSRGGGNPILAKIYDLRQKASQVIYHLFPDPEASILRGILLGMEAGIPQKVDQAFIDTGTSHIIAISGFNFAIVAALITSLFDRILGRWRGILAAFLGIALYAIIAGASAVVIRAAIMGSLTVFGSRIGRRSHGWNTLFFVAAIMTAFNPHVLWDVGFQLSFMATLGLVVYAQPMTEKFIQISSSYFSPETSQRISAPISEFFLYSIAAQITTLPIILYHFQRLSLISLLANFCILPAQPSVMIFGGIATIIGLIYFPLGKLLAYIALPFLIFTIRLVEMLAKVPNSAISIGKISLIWIILFYVLLFGGTFFGGEIVAWLRSKFPALHSQSFKGFVLIFLCIATAVIWRMVFSLPDGRIHISLLDVGSGEGILIQTPKGKNVLINGGSSANALSDGLGRRLPLERRKLDYLIIAGSEDEQLSGIPHSIDRFPPEKVIWSGPPLGSYSARNLRLKLSQKGIPIIEAQSGNVFDLGEGARLEILSTTEKGAILLIEWQFFRVLLPIGLDSKSLADLLETKNPSKVNAILLADCGSKGLTNREWLHRWQPDFILLSVAADDASERPSPDVLNLIEDYTILRTDKNGWIELSSDGRQIWIEVERRSGMK